MIGKAGTAATEVVERTRDFVNRDDTGHDERVERIEPPAAPEPRSRNGRGRTGPDAGTCAGTETGVGGQEGRTHTGTAAASPGVYGRSAAAPGSAGTGGIFGYRNPRQRKSRLGWRPPTAVTAEPEAQFVPQRKTQAVDYEAAEGRFRPTTRRLPSGRPRF